jgi:hypothetical protein
VSNVFHLNKYSLTCKQPKTRRRQPRAQATTSATHAKADPDSPTKDILTMHSHEFTASGDAQRYTSPRVTTIRIEADIAESGPADQEALDRQGHSSTSYNQD